MSYNKSETIIYRWLLYRFTQFDKNKTVTSPINGDEKCFQYAANDDKCFQYAATVALNHEEIGRKLQRISKMKPFINKYNCTIYYLLGKNDWKMFEKNNPLIAIKILYDKKVRLFLAYISKHILNNEDQTILVMVPNVEG